MRRNENILNARGLGPTQFLQVRRRVAEAAASTQRAVTGAMNVARGVATAASAVAGARRPRSPQATEISVGGAAVRSTRRRATSSADTAPRRNPLRSARVQTAGGGSNAAGGGSNAAGGGVAAEPAPRPRRTLGRRSQLTRSQPRVGHNANTQRPTIEIMPEPFNGYSARTIVQTVKAMTGRNRATIVANESHFPRTLFDIANNDQHPAVSRTQEGTLIIDSRLDPDWSFIVPSIMRDIRAARLALTSHRFIRTDQDRYQNAVDTRYGVYRREVWVQRDNLFTSAEDTERIENSRQGAKARMQRTTQNEIMARYYQLNYHLEIPAGAPPEWSALRNAAEAALLPPDVEEEVENPMAVAEAALLPPDVEEEVENPMAAVEAFPPPLPEPDDEEGDEDEPEDIPPNVWAQFEDHGGKMGPS